ncbi:permease, partial [Oleiphilus sp. HI0132]
EPSHDNWYGVIAHSVQELLNTMWWSILLAIAFVGVLSRIPQEFIISILGKGGTVKGLWRATLAGVLLDLCSHGILMVGMELRRKGASLGQVMAFLIASPWNSLSLTIIMVALIGLPWTLLFIALSMVLAITTGWLFDRLEQKGSLPQNSVANDLPEDFQFWREAKSKFASVEWTQALALDIGKRGLNGSRMVIRWLLFGVLLASAIRGFVSLEDFQNYFGPTLLGLGATLIAATIIEVCSEGSTPIAADLMNRANAPGNSFAFLMTGVATDYTEVMVIKDTMKSWKTALYLPLLTVPQVIVVAMILNSV